MKDHLPVNGDVLRWARERAGYSVQEIAERLKRTEEQIKAWENADNDSSPPYGTLEKLAYDCYRRPLALFFFPEPPEEDSIDKSFRTLPEHELNQIPPRIRYLIRNASVFQMNLAELFDGRNPASKPIIYNLKIALHDADNVVVFADQARDYLGVSVDEQRAWTSDEDALKAWRVILENHGVFTFKDSFKEKKKDAPESPYSGFCLYDEDFPIIYLNNNMPKTRQIFTLFHELAHLLASVARIDKGFGNDYINTLSGDDQRVEILCNRFSAEFLIPAKEINDRLKSLSSSPADEEISFFAQEFCVSREVILRRMRDLSIVAQGFYQKKVAQWERERTKRKERQKKSPGGHHANTQSTYLSKAYMERVFELHYKNQITRDQVADYLGTAKKPAKSDTIDDLENLLLKKT